MEQPANPVDHHISSKGEHINPKSLDPLRHLLAQGLSQEPRPSSIASLDAPHSFLTQPAFLEGSALGRMACAAHEVCIHPAHLCYNYVVLEMCLNKFQHPAHTVNSDVFLSGTGASNASPEFNLSVPLETYECNSVGINKNDCSI